MNLTKLSIKAFLISLISVFLFSACYTQLDLVSKERVYVTDDEEYYYYEEDTLVAEPAEEVYVEEYHIYDTPSVHRYHTFHYDPWWYWDDYYFMSSYYYPGWYRPYSYWGWHHYPFISIYDPYYHDDYYGHGWVYDSKQYAPKPFSRTGTHLRGRGSSRLSQNDGVGVNPRIGSSTNYPTRAVSGNESGRSASTDSRSGRLIKRLNDDEFTTKANTVRSRGRSTTTRNVTKENNDKQVNNTSRTRKTYYRVTPYSTKKSKSSRTVVRPRNDNTTKSSSSGNRSTVNKSSNNKSSSSPSVKKSSSRSTSRSAVKRSSSSSSSSRSSYSPRSSSSSRSSGSRSSGRSSSSRSSSSSGSSSKRR